MILLATLLSSCLELHQLLLTRFKITGQPMQNLVPFYCFENWAVESFLIKMLKSRTTKTNMSNDLNIVAFLSSKKKYNYLRFDITYKVTELFRGLIVFFFLTPDLFYRINRKSISSHVSFRFFLNKTRSFQDKKLQYFAGN